MSHDNPSMGNGVDASTSEDAEVARVLDEYLADLEAGRPADADRLLADHSAIASQLRGCLEVMHLAGRVAEFSGSLPVAEDDVPLGPRLADYRIIRQVGRGGMGIVYEAEQQSLRRRVALKVLPLASAIDPRQLRRFQVEAQAAAQLHHAHIVPVYAVGCERGVHYYAMQYIEGNTLAQLIRELRQLEGREAAEETATMVPGEDRELAGMLASGQLTPAQEPPATDALASAPAPAQPSARCTAHSSSSSTRTSANFRTVAKLGIQAAEALEHAHQEGVVHRDIKPANVMVDIKGHLWITDFGLARLQNDPGLTMSGDLVGTIRYMSPEQANGHWAVVDQRTDIHALGVTLYELVALEPAFRGHDRREVLRRVVEEEPRPLRAFNSAVPRELETIVRKATAKEPESRYLTAQDLADDLRRFLEHKPIKARRPTLLESAAKWTRRHPAIAASVLMSLVIAVIGFALATLLISKEQARTRRAYQAEAQLRREARKAVDEMYGQVAQQLLTEKPDMATVRRDFLEKALIHYRHFAARPEADTDSRHEAARALRRVGDIERQLGHYPEAEYAYRQAIPLLDDLAGHHPDEAAYRDELARCYELLGFTLSDTGRLQEGEGAFRAGIGLAERLAGDFPYQPRYQRRLAQLCSNLGTVLYKAGRIQEVEGLVRRGRDLTARLVDAYHEKGDRGGLAQGSGNLGAIHFEMGRSQEAEQELRAALRLFHELSVEHSDNRGERQTLAVIHRDLAEVLLDLGKLQEAEECLRSALALQEKLVSEFSNIFWYSAEMGQSEEVLGRVLVAEGRSDEAEQAFRRANAIAERLVADLPSRADGLPDLARARAGLGQVLGETGRSAESRDFFLRAREDWKKMVSISPKSADSHRALSRLLSDCPDARLRDPGRAVALAREAVDHSPHIASAWGALGMALYRAGDANEAVQALRRSVEMSTDGGVESWFFLAMALGKAGDKDQARSWYDKAVDWIVKSRPKDPDFRRLRAEAAAVLGLSDAPIVAKGAR